MKETKVGCGKPTGATVVGPKKEAATSEAINRGKEVSMTMVKIGNQAPDFEAPAFHTGRFFTHYPVRRKNNCPG